MPNRDTAAPGTGTFFDTEGLAEYLSLSESYLNQMRVRGDGPKYHKIGRKVIYRLADVEEWLARQAHRSTSEYTDPEQAPAA
ncbi:MAG: helix-turn-helix domain-containing protein [Alphaproteobacteria bacterium]|nr:helix-turn-helix domain-containing protein [Alphaproteobacteria bacterium]